MGGTGGGPFQAAMDQYRYNTDPAYAAQKEQAWNQELMKDPKFRLLKEQKEQQALEAAQKKQVNELNTALKFQRQYAANAQGKNGTLLTNPSANGIGAPAPAPATGQKKLLGE